MSDNLQSWQEHENEQIHTMENEEQSSEENVINPEGQATSEIVQATEKPEGKTETWKTSYPAPAGQMNIENPEMLLGSEVIHQLRSRWNEIQAKFVDEPGASVRQADALVAEVMNQVTQTLANQRRTLESQWNLADFLRQGGIHRRSAPDPAELPRLFQPPLEIGPLKFISQVRPVMLWPYLFISEFRVSKGLSPAALIPLERSTTISLRRFPPRQAR